jgi:hypothetical protein
MLFTAVRAWADRKVRETEGSLVLRAFGGALVVTHLLTVAYFLHRDLLARIVTSNDAICWPFLPGCEEVRTHSHAWVHLGMVAYGALAVATIAAFSRARWTRYALSGLVLLNLWKAFWFFQDYRLMGNYHYMPFLMSGAYLLFPRAKDVCRYLLVAFYVSAGALKLNREWLSGSALIAPTWLKGHWLEAGCAYVVGMELLFVFGLLAKNKIVRLLTLAQLIVFHAYSWHVVGFFYPTIMFTLLTVFPLSWFLEPENAEAGGADLDRFLVGRAGMPVYAALGVYALMQIAPALFPGDSAITGEGRMFAINMMDARVDCDPFAVVRREGTIREVSDLHPTVGLRIRCDPIRYIATAQNLCKAQRSEVDTYLSARRTTSETYTPVFAVTDACASKPRFQVLSHNEWMGAR